MELSANRARLKVLVQHLGDLSGDVVFIGGVVAELLQTRPLLPKPRATDDVDAVAAITSRGEYVSFQCRSLLERDDLEDMLTGALSSSAQLYEVVDVVQNRLTTLAGS